MVTIIPPKPSAAQGLGQGLGAGLGQGLEQSSKLLTNRYLLQSGLDEVRGEIEAKRQSGESINPLDVTFSLMSKIGTLPGGLQALSELAPSLHKEIGRLNLSREETPASRSKTMPPGSIIEQTGFQDGIRAGVGDIREDEQGRRLPTEKGLLPQEVVRAPISAEDFYDKKFRENLDRTQDVAQATALTQSQLAAFSSEQERRIQEQGASEKFLNQKIQENFPEGISAPFKNELSQQFFNRVQSTDANTAWKDLVPKFRAAQRAEENLKTATGSNRPPLFFGSLDERKEKARTALKDISDIDPEYAMGLAMDDLNWGPAEAASIIRPGDKAINQFQAQIPNAPNFNDPRYVRGTIGYDTKRFDKDINEWNQQTQKKLDKFFQKKWNPDVDSLLSLRAELYDKGLSESKFLESVNKAFPEKNQDPRLSVFNRHEYSKLSEPVVPGLQEIFSSLFTGKFKGLIDQAVLQRITKKR